MDNVKKIELAEGINITGILDQKFKTVKISFFMLCPMEKDTASKNAILPNLLVHSCEKYSSITLIGKKLEELYGASVSTSVQKMGDMQAIGITISGLANKYIPDGSDNVQNMTKLLCEFIFKPYLVNGNFDLENVEQEKRQLTEEILSEMNDKRIYAKNRCIKTMCENEKFGIDTLGTVEDVKKLHPGDILDQWKKLLSSSHVEIAVAGNACIEKVSKEFMENFKNIPRSNIYKYCSKLVKSRDAVKELIERKNVNQCKLVMGFKIKDETANINSAAMVIMNALLGGTPQSKLFRNVREKLSLCYYCSSKYIKNKHIVLIESGVEDQNLEKAKDNILQQLEDIKLGIFSESEFIHTKIFVVQGLTKLYDSLSSISLWYINENLEGNCATLKEFVHQIKSITREQVISVANEINLDTVYILTGKEE